MLLLVSLSTSYQTVGVISAFENCQNSDRPLEEDAEADAMLGYAGKCNAP